MTQFLKQSTAVDVMLGVFVDDTDGKTTEEALTLSSGDLYVSKNCGTAAEKNSVDVGTHLYGGNYKIPLDATDTNTLGRLDLMCKESGALPIKASFMIVAANIYDSLVLGTDMLYVDTMQLRSSTQSATDLQDFADSGYDPINNKIECCKVNDDMVGTDSAALAATALTDATWTDSKAAFLDHSIATVDGNVDLTLADTNELQTNQGNWATATGFATSGAMTTAQADLDTITGSDGVTLATAQSLYAPNKTVPDAAGIAATPAEVATALTNIHLDHLLAVDYDPTSKPGVATSLFNELIESDAGVSRYTANALEQAPTGGSAPTVDQIADGVWDELKSGHTVTDSFGDYLDDEITSRNPTTPPTVVEIRTEMDTNSTKMAPSQTLADYKATGFSTHVAADIWSVATRILTASTNFNDISTAQVNTEIDTALTDIHLDHLLAVNYDPASKPGTATALLNELVENDGGVSRYTANALEQAPSGGTNPNVLIDTTINGAPSSQTVFVLTAGSSDDDAYNDQAIVLYDASNSDYPSVRKVSDYVGSTKTVTIDSAPDFTIIAGDGVKVFVTAPGTTAPTAAQNADAVWDELKVDHLVADSYGDYLDDEITSRNATTPPTVTAIRQEMDANSTKMAPSQTLADYKATGFNTTTPPTVGEIADQVWDEILTGATHNIPTSAGRRVREISAFAIHGGTAQSGNGTSITLATTASASDGIYNRNLIAITEGTGAGQTRQIAEYDGTTKVVSTDREWRVSPDATSIYQITADNVFALVDQGNVVAATATTVTLRSYAASINDTYLCNQIAIISGTGRGQARLIGGYNGTTKVATICGDNWVTIPDATSVYVMIPYGTTCTSCIGDHALGLINTECDTANSDYGANTVTPDAEGVAPTAVEIRTEMDTNSTKMAPSQVLADYKATGFNTTTPPTVGEIRTEMEGVGTKLTDVLGDTAELQGNQTDWATATSVTVSDKTGFALSTAGVDAILDEYIEGTHSLREMMRLFASMLVGKVSGGGTATVTFRDIDDSKNRIVMTVTDVGNRTGVVLTED